jgi:hypothetical protein
MASGTLTVAVDPVFDAEYLKAQPIAIQNLMKMPYGSDKLLEAQTLQNEGYVIEGTIMVYGWSASYATSYFLSLGYTWVPEYGQPPVSIAPGLSQGTTPPYSPTIVPPGGILLTLNPALLPGIYPQPKGVVAS